MVGIVAQCSTLPSAVDITSIYLHVPVVGRSCETENPYTCTTLTHHSRAHSVALVGSCGYCLRRLCGYGGNVS